MSGKAISKWRKVWIKRRNTNGTVRYDLRWYDEHGRQCSRYAGRNRRDAEALRWKKEQELNGLSAAAPTPIDYTEFVREHLRLRQGSVSPRTIENEERVLRTLGEICQPKNLTDLTPAAIEIYKATRLPGRSPNSINLELRALRSILEKAVKRSYLRDNPARKVDLAEGFERPLRVLNVDEVEKLLAACPNLKWRVFCYLAVACGLRSGEIINLRWENVDRDQGVVHIVNTQSWKSKSRRNRLALLNDRGQEMLRNLRQRSASGYVLKTRNGTQWGNNIKREFARIVKKAGIRDCSPHDLRRTFCSQLAMAGINEAVVQKLAGHANIQTTLKYYTVIAPENLRQAVKELPY